MADDNTKGLQAEITRLMDGMELAWGIIANAGGGNWQATQSPEWIGAAERWRDEHWHPSLDRNGYAAGREDNPELYAESERLQTAVNDVLAAPENQDESIAPVANPRGGERDITREGPR